MDGIRLSSPPTASLQLLLLTLGTPSAVFYCRRCCRFWRSVRNLRIFFFSSRLIFIFRYVLGVMFFLQLSLSVLSMAISYPTHHHFHFCLRASKQIIVMLASWIVCALLYISYLVLFSVMVILAVTIMVTVVIILLPVKK